MIINDNNEKFNEKEKIEILFTKDVLHILYH